jgi:NDP-hexose 4-ketoreductase
VMGGARLLLLGASGFLGRAVGEVLDSDAQVEAVVRVTSRAPDGADADGWVRHDLFASPPENLVGLLRTTRPDVVVNCVGKLAGTEEALVAANVLLPARLVDAMPAAAPDARLVTIGSAAEYGVVPQGVPVTEDAPTAPVGSYGVTKLAATQLVRLAARNRRLEGVVLRVFNPIGPHVPTENLLGRAASGLRTALEIGQDSVRFGPLAAYRDFVDVRDVASAVRAVALAPAVPEPVLNVGSGMAIRARDAVSRLAELAGYTGRLEESEAPPSRSAAVDWIAADTSRLRTLGWTPRHDLDSSLQAVWDTSAPHETAVTTTATI